MDNRRFIARRAAQYFNEGDTVNLGIGIPSACSDFVDPTIAFQTENGMIGVGPVAKKLAICDTYQNAGGINFVPVMGASAFDTAYSFAVIRSGRMAATVLGALQVAENGDIANWASPGRIRYGRCYGPLQRCKKSYCCHGTHNQKRRTKDLKEMYLSFNSSGLCEPHRYRAVCHRRDTRRSEAC